MPSKIERVDRDTGEPIDAENLKRKSWSGFSAEFVKFPGAVNYNFKVRGAWAHLFLFDLYRTDGETVVGNDTLRMSAKDLRNRLIFAPPGCPVDGWCALDKPGSITTVAISPGIQSDLGVKLDGLPALLGFEDEMLRGALLRFQALLTDPSYDCPYYAKSIVELVAFDLARVSRTAPLPQVATGALGPHQLRIVTDYIDANLSHRPRVTKLAKLVDMSRFHFMRSFKQAVGVPPHQFVIARRIERAKLLLAEGNQSVATVAAETGFGTSIQLARAFNRAIGVTPSEYRRQSIYRLDGRGTPPLARARSSVAEHLTFNQGVDG